MDTDRKLYLANLPQDIAEEELREVFGVYGRIEEVIVLGSKAADRTDRTGFVKFVDKEDAAAALAVLNDMYQFREDSETVRVSWARPHRDDKGHKGHGHGYGHTGQSGGKGPPMPPLPAPPTGGPPPPPPAAPPPPPMPAPKGGGGFRGPGQGEKLWVGNLPGDITETEMHKAFGQFGSVDEVNILPARSRSGQLCAFVRYATAAEAEACISGMVAFKFRPGDAEEIKIERPADRSRKGGKGDGWGKGGWGHGAASGCGGCGGCGGCSGCGGFPGCGCGGCSGCGGGCGCQGYHAACGGCACGGACGGCGDGQWVQGCGGCGQRYQPY